MLSGFTASRLYVLIFNLKKGKTNVKNNFICDKSLTKHLTPTESYNKECGN
jgi:hypothetical protein